MSDPGAIDPELFEATVNAAWEAWKRGSPQGNYFDMLDAISAALSIAKPMIEKSVIEALAAEAEREDGRMWRRFALSEISAAEALGYVADWLRAHIDPEAGAAT